MRRTRIAISAAALCLAPAVAAAQVGYEPARSPFRDLDFLQEVTIYSGVFDARKDPAQVAPRGGTIIGIQYLWRVGGPISITADLARLGTERRVVDPIQPESCPGVTGSCKVIGDFRWPMYFANAGLALSLTGPRSFHRLVPYLKGGIGLVTDFHTSPDVGDFAFGTRFAFTWGAAVSWIPPGSPFQVRMDFTNHLYTLRYPDSYYVAAEDGTRILEPTRKRSLWLNNPALTLGISYLFAR